MDIGPGDYVECVREPLYANPYCHGAVLTPNAVYRVEEVRLDDRFPDGVNRAALVLAEAETKWFVPGGVEGSWCLTLFRPVYRPKADAFTHLLTEIPSDLEAV